MVSRLFTRPEIAIYGPSGVLLATYDKLGSGPGELRSSPLLFMGRADTLYAFERGRVIRFDSTLRHVDSRQTGFQVRTSAVILDDGRLVIDGRVPIRDSSFFAITLLSPDGAIVTSVRESVDRSEAVLLSPSLEDGFWVVESGIPLIERYSSSGALRWVIRLERPWFAPATTRSGSRTSTEELHVANAGVVEISPDRIVLLTWLPESSHRRLASGSGGPTRPSEFDLDGTWDTVLEVLDARTGASIAVSRVDEALSPVRGTRDEFFSARKESDGHVVLDIWKLKVERAVPSSHERLRYQLTKT